jgi:hypothetical protein
LVTAQVTVSVALATGQQVVLATNPQAALPTTVVMSVSPLTEASEMIASQAGLTARKPEMHHQNSAVAASLQAKAAGAKLVAMPAVAMRQATKALAAALV